MKFTSLLAAFFCLILISCEQSTPKKQPEETVVQGETYQSPEIGWSIEIPKGWSVVSKDQMEANDQRGKEAMEKATGQTVNAEGLKHLISFSKNKFNAFAATAEPFAENFPGEYDVNNRAVYDIIYNTYADQGIKTDTTSGIEMCQGLEFKAFYTTIYDPEGKVILNQILFNRLVNGNEFAVNINYNNDMDKKTMLDAWKNSKFNQQ